MRKISAPKLADKVRRKVAEEKSLDVDVRRLADRLRIREEYAAATR